MKLDRHMAAGPDPRALRPTPFDARTRPLNLVQDWIAWNGHATPGSLVSVEAEYFAIRNQSTLYDLSPMHKYRLRGPQAGLVVDRLVTRALGALVPGRVMYVIWCDEDGHVIDDGTLFRLGADDYRLCCQHPQLGWLADIAWGFDATVTDETDDLAALALQGPTSWAVLRAAGFDAAAGLRPFDHIGVGDVLVSRTGFTGDLGYELMVPPDGALALWDRLMAAGGDPGLRAIGWTAVNMARIEAGFLAPGIDFVPAHQALRPGRARTPFELGLGWMVDLDKGPFNGRRALAAAALAGPRWHHVALDIAGGAAATDALVYRGRREVGQVTSALWSPTAKRNIAFATLRAPHGGAVRDRLAVEIYLDKEGKWERRLAPATVVRPPFFRPARRGATPPGPF